MFIEEKSHPKAPTNLRLTPLNLLPTFHLFKQNPQDPPKLLPKLHPEFLPCFLGQKVQTAPKQSCRTQIQSNATPLSTTPTQPSITTTQPISLNLKEPQTLALCSWSLEDFGFCVVPHPSKPQRYQMPPPLPSLFILNISGQPSDSAGGTFKSFFLKMRPKQETVSTFQLEVNLL